MRKEENLRNALLYIEDNIKKPIRLEDVSKIAGYSVPQFYRLFKRLTSDTLGEYVIRRKMSMAAKDLEEHRLSISEIAFLYGFESHDVFTRSFRRVYGVTPHAYRQCPQPIKPLKTASIPIQNTLEDNLKKEDHKNKEDYADSQDNPNMTFALQAVEELTVVGMECEACIWDRDGAIGRLWSEFLNRLGEITIDADAVTMYGICESDSCQGDHFIYMAAVGVKQVDLIPKGMVARTIKRQKFFEARVPEQISTPDAYTSAINYAKSLGYEIAPYDQLEVYPDVFKDPEDHRFRLWIPIETT